MKSSIIDYQKVSDAFQKEWLAHPIILTEDPTPHPERDEAPVNA